MRRLARPLARVGAASAAGAAGVALWLRGAREEYLAIEEDALPHKYVPSEIAAVWREVPQWRGQLPSELLGTRQVGL